MGKKRTMNYYRQTKDAIYTPKYHPKTGDLNPEYEEGQLEIPFADVDFVNEVEEFNRTFGKPNNYEPKIPEKKEWQFVYDFILEELEEYRQACENGDIVEVLMLCVILLMFPLGTGLCYTALRIRYGQPIKKYKTQICQSLASLRRKQWKLSPSALKNKLSHVILRK